MGLEGGELSSSFLTWGLGESFLLSGKFLLGLLDDAPAVAVFELETPLALTLVVIMAALESDGSKEAVHLNGPLAVAGFKGTGRLIIGHQGAVIEQGLEHSLVIAQTGIAQILLIPQLPGVGQVELGELLSEGFKTLRIDEVFAQQGDIVGRNAPAHVTSILPALIFCPVPNP